MQPGHLQCRQRSVAFRPRLTTGLAIKQDISILRSVYLPENSLRSTAKI